MTKNIKYVRITFPLSENAKDPNEAMIMLAREYGISNAHGLFDFCDEGPDSVRREFLNSNMQEDLTWITEHENKVRGRSK